jgi:hypothetical protein
MTYQRVFAPALQLRARPGPGSSPDRYVHARTLTQSSLIKHIQLRESRIQHDRALAREFLFLLGSRSQRVTLSTNCQTSSEVGLMYSDSVGSSHIFSKTFGSLFGFAAAALALPVELVGEGAQIGGSFYRPRLRWDALRDGPAGLRDWRIKRLGTGGAATLGIQHRCDAADIRADALIRLPGQDRHPVLSVLGQSEMTSSFVTPFIATG